MRITTRAPRARGRTVARRGLAGLSSLLLGVTVLPAGLLAPAHAAAPPIIGNGVTVTTGDLAFILKQIKIAERHSVTRTAANPCGTLVNQPGDGIPDDQQLPDALTSFGLRTVDGSCNNLVKPDPSAASFFHNRATFGAADQPFPRLTKPVFRDAEPITPA